MKIEIDTSRDSKEEIRKAIKLLTSLIEESQSREFTGEAPAGFAMFDQPAEPKEEKKDKKPSVQFY